MGRSNNDTREAADLVAIVRDADWSRAATLPEAEIAQHLPDLSLADQDLLLQNQPIERVANILSEAEEVVVRPLLDKWTAREVAEVVRNLTPDDGADLLGSMDVEESQRVLEMIEDDQAEEARHLMSYDPGTAGGLMTPDCVKLPTHYTVEEALGAISESSDAEIINYVYVIDSDGRLEGVASMRDLLNAELTSTLDDVMTQHPVTVHVADDDELVAAIASRSNLVALPVLDDAGRLKGIVTVDDIIDVVEDEASEDMFRLAGTGTGTPTLEPILSRVGKRLPYLCITLVGGGIAAFVLSRYEADLKHTAALSFFVPVVIGMAGNVGIQSSTVVVRGLATGEITPKRFGKVLRHEMGIGVSLALFFCVVSGLLVALLAEPLKYEPTFGATVGIGMAAGIVMAALVGTSVPLGCARIGVDPALAAGPFVTTTNDALGVLVYLQVALWLKTVL